jgi:protein-tyrosine phosphatase
VGTVTLDPAPRAEEEEPTMLARPAIAPQLSRRRFLQVAVAAGATLAFVPACAGAKAPPAAPAPVVDAPALLDETTRFVPVDGAFNVRDLGGYRTGQGSTVVTGRLFRSSSLNRVTDTGLGQLEALRLHTVVDFRGERELRRGVDRVPAGVNQVAAPVPGAMMSGPPVAGGLPAPDPDTEAEFRGYVTDAGARRSFGAALRAVAEAGGAPVLWHCNSGTYRTGWASAVLLSALGVARTEIYADFLLSNTALGGTYSFAEYLDAAFAAADAEFGSLAGYLDKGLGLGPDIQDRLRRQLLA